MELFKQEDPFKLCADEETQLIFNGLQQQVWNCGHHQWPWGLQPGGQLLVPGRMLRPGLLGASYAKKVLFMSSNFIHTSL